MTLGRVEVSIDGSLKNRGQSHYHSKFKTDDDLCIIFAVSFVRVFLCTTEDINFIMNQMVIF